MLLVISYSHGDCFMERADGLSRKLHRRTPQHVVTGEQGEQAPGAWAAPKSTGVCAHLGACGRTSYLVSADSTTESLSLASPKSSFTTPANRASLGILCGIFRSICSPASHLEIPYSISLPRASYCRVSVFVQSCSQALVGPDRPIPADKKGTMKRLNITPVPR